MEMILTILAKILHRPTRRSRAIAVLSDPSVQWYMRWAKIDPKEVEKP